MRSSLERTIEKGLLLGIGSNLLTTESIRICSSKPYLIRHRIYENEYLAKSHHACCRPRRHSGRRWNQITGGCRRPRPYGVDRYAASCRLKLRRSTHEKLK